MSGALRTRLWALALLGCGFSAGAVEPLTISRLQLRASEADTYSFTESLYHRFEGGTYFLQIYDNEKDPQADSDHERFEFFLGKPLDERVGWVLREQKWSSAQPISSVGVQLELGKLPFTADLLRRMNAGSFVQVFAKNRSELLGNWEVLHYYQLKTPLGLPLEIRGNNIYYHRQEGDLWNLWLDAIHPVHRHWDLYLRWNYLSEADPLLGREGNTTSLGVRFNF
ncbi:hypothetical protein [Pseudomonas sp. 2FE]|uniref:hypothetical protein n=1 Tax=Pseudomonas sp. 2FE TaxID=2502190 RepID=UPI0010F8B1ED|nr:hypothetical protein [Pseudomonas sp. 2FE]